MSLRHVFLLAAIPVAAVVVVLAVSVHEPVRDVVSPQATSLRAGLGALGTPFRRIMLAVLLFTLGNSTDAFLLLRLTGVGLSAAAVALVWAAFHVVKMTAAWIAGGLSDRVGRRPLVLAGWLWYAAIYVLFAVVASPRLLIAVFLAYGLYYGLTEPVEKAWVGDLAPPDHRGTAFGVYNAVVGLAALPASILFGLIWKLAGAPAAFATGACFAAAAAGVIATVRSAKPSG